MSNDQLDFWIFIVVIVAVPLGCAVGLRGLLYLHDRKQGTTTNCGYD